ncbi:MAG: aldolase/citrate lyase family protein [Pseudolabrys sp.]
MTWGPEDISAELGAETNRDEHGLLTEPYRLARNICLYGAAAAKLPAIETVYVDFRNSEGLRRDTEHARRDGFSGRLAIHPAQVAVINEVVHADAGADRQGQDGGGGFCGAARRRSGRHRRQDVRPAAFDPGAESAGAGREVTTPPPRRAAHVRARGLECS